VDHLRRYPMRYTGNPGQYPTTTFQHSGTSVTTSSVEIVGARWQRFHLRIQNQGTASVWIRFDGGTAVKDSTAYELTPGSWWTGYTIPGSAVTAITTGTQGVHVELGQALSFLRVVAGGVQVVAGGVPVVVPES